MPQAPALLENFRPGHVIADKAYDSKDFRTLIAEPAGSNEESQSEGKIKMSNSREVGLTDTDSTTEHRDEKFLPPPNGHDDVHDDALDAEGAPPTEENGERSSPSGIVDAVDDFEDDEDDQEHSLWSPESDELDDIEENEFVGEGAREALVEVDQETHPIQRSWDAGLTDPEISEDRLPPSDDLLVDQARRQLHHMAAQNPFGAEMAGLAAPATIFDAFERDGPVVLCEHIEQFFDVVARPSGAKTRTSAILASDGSPSRRAELPSPPLPCGNRPEPHHLLDGFTYPS